MLIFLMKEGSHESKSTEHHGGRRTALGEVGTWAKWGARGCTPVLPQDTGLQMMTFRFRRHLLGSSGPSWSQGAETQLKPASATG